MDPSSVQHPGQEINSQTLESMLACTKSQQDKKPRPHEQALKCPRCESTNTKFCYYNNYSLSQPRYFCKSCRRYWTKGGTLRNVPVGGGCRKNKRSSSSSSSTSSSKRSQDHNPLTTISNPLSSFTPLSSYDSNDLTLAFARLQKQTTAGQLGLDGDHHHDLSLMGNPSNTHCGDILGSHHHAGFFDALRGGGFLNEPSPQGFHNFYYGIGDGNSSMNNLENGGIGGGENNVGDEMGIPYEDHMSAGATTTATTVTTVKQELCNNGDHNSRVFWGFPWQLNGDANIGGDLDSGRHSWNGLGAASSWHGLLNSPLL